MNKGDETFLKTSFQDDGEVRLSSTNFGNDGRSSVDAAAILGENYQFRDHLLVAASGVEPATSGL
jgi:hypothetical protein